ncbi:MAG TPA: pitrilysin family protein [Terriglobales bacterium]|jgi:predicted Zn-dependent peptidase|nr:pitrilysin family protein [Terriglobales bacterium]
MHRAVRNSLSLLIAFLSTGVLAQDVASFEKKTSVKTLANGLTIVVCERHEAPVFSFYTLVDAGAAQDPKGETGMAHMFEHMAFKGTTTIGTTDYAAEKVALEKEEDAYLALQQERLKRVGRDPKKVEELEKAFHQDQEDADKYVKKNEFGEIIESQGGEDLNATTAEDETSYFYSMPVNRLELWAYMESERFLHPVLREFYQERDVVYEERRMRTDSSPIGRMIEQFLATAYMAHPYRNPDVGWPSDLESLTRTDARQFFDKYYVASNMTIAVVGDVKPDQVFALAEKYFGRLPAKPKPEDLHTIEPPQVDERNVTIPEPSQPIYLEGFHRGDYRDKDDAVYDAISDLLSEGRTSRLYRSLVRDKKIAATAVGFTDFPGVKYPSLFGFYAVPVPGHTPAELQAAFKDEIDRIKTQDVSDAELEMVKTRAKANLIRGLGENSGLAAQLAIYQARYGDWRELFYNIDRLQKVTKEDIRRVANSTFTPTNRTVAIVQTVAPAAAPGGSGGER